MSNHLSRIVSVLLLAFVLESFSVLAWVWHRTDTLQRDLETQVALRRLKHEEAKQAMFAEFETKEYLETGNNVYERVYNTQSQGVSELIHNLAREALPPEWTSEVKTEEFRHFLLLVHVADRSVVADPTQMGRYLVPVVTYSHPYLSSVAVFDKFHRCRLFFDEEALSELRTHGVLSQESTQRVREEGNGFVRFDSVRIDGVMVQGHLYVPVTIYGVDGVVEGPMMLDTGASISVISLDTAHKTGSEDLNRVRRQTFQTANGLINCPIVKRTISVGGIDRAQDVAVNVNDDANLLGMDFFRESNYLIDSANECIYVWAK